MVMDESISASSRAQLNAEEHAKFKERKLKIKKALVLRLIVDQEELDLKEECTGSKALSAAEKEMEGDDLQGELKCATIALDEAAAADHHGSNNMERTTTTEKQTDETLTAPLSSTTSSSTVSPPTSPTTNPSSSLRATLTSPSRLLSSLSCPNTAACNIACGPTNFFNCSGVHGKLTAAHNISLTAFIGAYGEECNICLSKFQVGDSAAWSKHHCDTEHSTVDGVIPNHIVPTQLENDVGNGCNHVFHEECISRWLLVRDGCPVCRRSYFSNVSDPIQEVDLERGIEQTI